GWNIADDGLEVVFSRDIPTLVGDQMSPLIDGFLRGQGLALSDIDAFACHPGGAKVLDALEDIFELPAGGLVVARDVLRRHGNRWAARVLLVLRDTLAAGQTGRLLLTPLGRGFTAAMMLIDAR